MGWDASLVDDRGHVEGDWNYTYNVTPMLRIASEVAGVAMTDQRWMGIDGAPEVGFSRWLDGRTGAEGQALLVPLIQELESNPSRYEAMNPPNGWGSYAGILGVLREMVARTPEWPTRWTAT